MSELNPNHPVTQAMHNRWHVLAALLMQHFKTNHVVITMEDAQALDPDGCIVVHEKPDGLHLLMVDRSTGEQLARDHGGLPH